MTRHEIAPRRHCILCDAYAWPYRDHMYTTPEAAAHARAEYIRTRRSWRTMRRTVARWHFRATLALLDAETFPQDAGEYTEAIA